MKLINFSVVAAAFFVYGCEEKKEFKIKTPVEMCMEQRNLPRALCECIKDQSKAIERTAHTPPSQQPEESENLTHELPEPGSEVGPDGTINEVEYTAHNYGDQGNGWEGSGSRMMNTMNRLNEEEDARLEECLKTLEIK